MVKLSIKNKWRVIKKLKVNLAKELNSTDIDFIKYENHFINVK